MPLQPDVQLPARPKFLPAYTLPLPSTSSVSTWLFMPVSKALQVEPFHLAMYSQLVKQPPGFWKTRPAYTLPLPSTATS